VASRVVLVALWGCRPGGVLPVWFCAVRCWWWRGEVPLQPNPCPGAPVAGPAPSVKRHMNLVRTAIGVALVVLAAVTATGCGSDSGLRSPDYGALDELKTGAEREAWIRTDLLVGLPWREAQQMADDAGWHTEVYFPAEDQESMAWSLDLQWDRLRIVVEGGEETGTVSNVVDG